MNFSMKLVYQYMKIVYFFNKSSSFTTSPELRQQFAACGGEDDNGKFRLERVNPTVRDRPFSVF